jgi:hypothetical protein
MDPSGPFHPKFAELLARRGSYPFGTFPGGDIVCWEERGLAVILHDNFEAIEPRMHPEEFFQQLSERSPDLEEKVFASAL